MTRAKVIAWILEGKSDRAVAELASSSRRTFSHQAITAFRKRYAADIAALTQQVVVAVQEATIRDKGERIRRYDQVAKELREIIETRGYMAKDIKWVQVYFVAGADTPKPTFEKGPREGDEKPVKTTPDGDWMIPAGETLVQVEKFDAALVQKYFDSMHAVAEELGELPKPIVNVDNRTLNMFVQLAENVPAALEREPDDS